MSPESASVLQRLFRVIEDRRINPPKKSYTTSLFEGGVPKIASKIAEEAVEVNEAAAEDGDEGRQHLVEEAADLVYHLLVMLAHRQVTLTDVEQVLAGRFGVSGIDEKESRSSK
jgi:phosphoribosyl-ATP pyrophosphohydrolase